MVEHFLQPFIITEVLQVLVEFLREGVDLDAFYDLQEETIRQVSDCADELTAEGGIVFKREFEELYLSFDFLLAFEDIFQLRKVSLCGKLSNEELLVLVEGNFEVFVDGVKQRNADVLHLLFSPLFETSSHTLSIDHFHLLQEKQLIFFLLLKVAQQGNDAGYCLCLILLVLQ